MNNRVEGFKAGCDLEMPTSNGMFDDEVKNAVEEGMLKEEDIDRSVERILKLIFKSRKNKKKNDNYEIEGHHQLAKEIALESAVLLKNDKEILPLNKTERITLCGELADAIRYQGAGSSHINPTKLSSLKVSMEEIGASISYYPSYEINGEKNDAKLQAAIEGAKHADKVVLVIGLPDSFESEGYDREHMRLPESHNELVEKVAEVNDNIIVVLMTGSPVEMPWVNKVKAILNMNLGGQAVGEAGADILYGTVNPSGKLSESYPVTYQDCSTSNIFGINPRQAIYKESIYVGYRYYEKAGIKVQFPFGHGLSYTSFAYSDLQLDTQEVVFNLENNDSIMKVKCKVKNVGEVAGSEVVQLYVGDSTSENFKARKELKGFYKVYLLPGEEEEVTFTLDKRSFAHYDIKSKDWEVLSGIYTIYIGSSSEDIRLKESLNVKGTVSSLPYEDIPHWYISPKGKPGKKEFEQIYGEIIKPYRMEEPGEYTMLNTINDMKDNPIIQQIMEGMKTSIIQSNGGDENDPSTKFTLSIVYNTPVIRLVQSSAGTTPKELMELVVECANGNDEASRKLIAFMTGGLKDR